MTDNGYLTQEGNSGRQRWTWIGVIHSLRAWQPPWRRQRPGCDLRRSPSPFGLSGF